jgi:putative chitinase
MKLTAEFLNAIHPKANSVGVAVLVKNQMDLHKAGILDSLDRLCVFAANVAVESAGFQLIRENMNYSAKRLVQVWPKRFNATTAKKYANKPQLLASFVYANRLGNGGPETQDGWLYRGGGFAQVTGRETFSGVGSKCDLDLINNPDYVTHADYATRVAAGYWTWKGLAAVVDAGQLEKARRMWNGGTIGMEEFRTFLKRAKANTHLLDLTGSNVVVVEQEDTPEDIKRAQQRLLELGYAPGKVDGAYGNLTRAAILAFEADHGLPYTGKVSDALYLELMKAAPRPLSEERKTTTIADLREAGSETIKTGDSAKVIAGATTVTAGVGAVNQAAETLGVDLDSLDSVTQKISLLKTITNTATEFFAWVGQHWWMPLLVVGLLSFIYVRKMQLLRVKDAQTGMNLGK